VARRPLGEFHHDFVADLCAVRRLGVHVVQEPRIIGDDVMEVARLLKRADHGVVRAFEDADDTPRRFRVRRGATLALKACQHFVAMKRHAGVLFRDVDVARVCSFGNEKRKSLFTEHNPPGDKVGLLRQNKPVLAHAGDFAPLDHLIQHTSELAPLRPIQAQRYGQVGPPQRMIVRRAEPLQDLGADVHRMAHINTMCLSQDETESPPNNRRRRWFIARLSQGVTV